MAFRGGQFTVTASATSLTSALSLSEKVHCRQLDIKAKSTNTGKVYFGNSDVTNVPANAHGELGAGESWSVPVDSTININTDEVFVVGPGTSEVIFIAVVGGN